MNFNPQAAAYDCRKIATEEEKVRAWKRSPLARHSSEPIALDVDKSYGLVSALLSEPSTIEEWIALVTQLGGQNVEIMQVLSYAPLQEDDSCNIEINGGSIPKLRVHPQVKDESGAIVSNLYLLLLVRSSESLTAAKVAELSDIATGVIPSLQSFDEERLWRLGVEEAGYDLHCTCHVR